MPRKLLIAGVVLLVLASVSAYSGFGLIEKYGLDRDSVTQQKNTGADPDLKATSDNGLYSSSLANAEDKPLTIADMTPVLPTMPYTSPYYKDVAQPVTFPRFAGCMRSFHKAKQKEVCRCVTQQGATLSVPLDQCSAVIDDDGMPFDPFKPDSQSQQLASAAPVVPPDTKGQKPTNSM